MVRDGKANRVGYREQPNYPSLLGQECQYQRSEYGPREPAQLPGGYVGRGEWVRSACVISVYVGEHPRRGGEKGTVLLFAFETTTQGCIAGSCLYQLPMRRG